MIRTTLLALLIIVMPMQFALCQDAPKPVPILKKATTPISIEIPDQKPKAKWNPKTYEGATRCVQEGDRVTCNNGYQTTVR